MIVRLLAAVLGMGLLAVPATAHSSHHHGLDGKAYTVQLDQDGGGERKTDSISFRDGHMESAWLAAQGFGPVPYDGDDDDFEATFQKGDERVKYKGHWDDGQLEGDVSWRRRHEGGHREWKITGGGEGAAAPSGGTAAASLYQRLGGNAAITAVVSEFVDVFVKDPVLNANPAVQVRFRNANVAWLKGSLTRFLCQAAGGPEKYTGRDMKTVHAEMQIGEKDWAAIASDLVGVLNKFKVPAAEQEELLALVGTTKADIVTRP